MPSFNTYKQLNSRTVGQTHKFESDLIMEGTWYNDINHRTAYLYDWYHDDNKLQLRDLNPEEDDYKIPIEIKYLQNSQQSMSKDQITFHIQLKPGQECNVDYYESVFQKRYHSIFPCGLYIDIQDEQEQYNRWLIVAKANYYNTQFPTFEILPCDYIFRWIHDGEKYEMAGVLRSQNSYNSGVWTDYKETSVQDQQKFIVPLNRDSEHLFYDKRMIIDAPVLTEPRTWSITKVNRLAENGLNNITLAQNKFDQHTDFIEVDEDGNVIGMWADYYTKDQHTNLYEVGEITYSGLKPEIKVNGGYKKFSIITENNIDLPKTGWSFSVDGIDVTENFIQSEGADVLPNQIKVKFVGDENTYVGKTVDVSYLTDDVQATLKINLVAL